MALKLFTDQPRITDTILLKIQTTDSDGCPMTPYKIDSVTIFYAERNFIGLNHGEYDYQIVDGTISAKLDSAVKAACLNPTSENMAAVVNLQKQVASATMSTPFYYKEVIPVDKIGSPNYPAWLSSDLTESPFTQSVDEDNNLIPGAFEYQWNPNGSIREGNFFLCWTWTPRPAGDSLTSHIPFFVVGDPRAVTTIPTHVTPEDKYDVLLERYLPEMYKSYLSENDLTPDITYKFNKAIGQGFTVIENFANQIIDLFDANALHESLLKYLSNLFDLKLKSDDPTLWRRQIKEAIPLFKRKGTLGSLQSAFSQAGMMLNSFTQHWQIKSKYTYQESFVVKDSASFTLTKKSIVLPIDDDNFGLWIRRHGETHYPDSDIYVPLTSDYVSFEIDEECHDKVIMTWIGDQLSSQPENIYEGDIIRVMYQFNDVPSDPEQQLENYIRSLPYLDTRNEVEQSYPPKNWNTRIIDESDPMFSVLIPVKNPFADPVVFGFVRTEFAYSENIYNMEEYNGSTRPSFDACNIDKTFIDPCGSCIGSSYSVDIGVENLCNDRMLEAQDVLKENMPFHAELQTISFTGEFNEFALPPQEQIDFLIRFNKIENVLSGQANPIFTRHVESQWIVDREQLADKTTVQSGKFGTGTNEGVSIFCAEVNFEDIGVLPNNHILEVLSPSANTGTYTIGNFNNHTAWVTSSVTEPLDESQFTFNLSNVTYTNFSTVITQDDYFKFSDQNVLFEDLGVKTLWDVDNTPNYTGGSWKVLLPYSVDYYEIRNIVNGALILNGDSNLPTVTTSNINYTLVDDNEVIIHVSTTGDLRIERRALINFNNINLNTSQVVSIGSLLYYSGNEYKVVALSGQNFWIEGWTDGDMSGISVDIRKRIAKEQTGQFGYRGLHLSTLVDHEAEFQIQNGDNPPTVVLDNGNFKENYMFNIGSNFFKILEWNGTEITLDGLDQYWMTDGGGGTSVS